MKLVRIKRRSNIACLARRILRLSYSLAAINIIHCYEAREKHIRPEAYATSRRHQDSVMDNHVLVIALIPFVEWNSDGFL